MALHYTYKEYKNFPLATEISKSRARGHICLTQLCIWGIILVIIMLFGFEKSAWDWLLAILLIILFAAGLFYLFTYYDIVTEKKIKMAIEKELQIRETAEATRHICKSIKISGRHTIGMCDICYQKNIDTTLCEIAFENHTRTAYVCDSCKIKFMKKNLRQ